MHPFSADSTCQTENLIDGGDATGEGAGFHQPLRISRLEAKLVETIARGRQDRWAASRRVALSRVVSVSLIVTTTVTCLLLQRSGIVDLAFGRTSVAVVGLFWFWSTFTEAFKRDTRRACNGISLLCFVAWSFSHIFWRVFSSEATGNDDTGVGAPAWVWVDIGVAWAMAPAAGGSLQLSLWGSIVPSWLCVTVALCYGLRTEEVALDGDGLKEAGVLVVGVGVFALSVLAIGYQVLWEQARDARTLISLEGSALKEDEKRRQASFSELLLRHLLTEPSLQVLSAGVKELTHDARMSIIHSDALEQLEDGISMLKGYGEKALAQLRIGAPELSPPVLEHADMEEILDACLRTTAFLAISRDHHKVQLDMRVAPDVNKTVLTFPMWLSQMTRACLIHALHPEEKESVVLRVSYSKPGVMRVGVEAVWRAAGKVAATVAAATVGEGSRPTQESEGGGKLLSGWDHDMPAAVWWVRAAALSLGGEADYSRSASRPGSHELWFTIPATNIPDDDEGERNEDQGHREQKHKSNLHENKTAAAGEREQYARRLQNARRLQGEGGGDAGLLRRKLGGGRGKGLGSGPEDDTAERLLPRPGGAALPTKSSPSWVGPTKRKSVLLPLGQGPETSSQENASTAVTAFGGDDDPGTNSSSFKPATSPPSPTAGSPGGTNAGGGLGLGHRSSISGRNRAGGRRGGGGGNSPAVSSGGGGGGGRGSGSGSSSCNRGGISHPRASLGGSKRWSLTGNFSPLSHIRISRVETEVAGNAGGGSDGTTTATVAAVPSSPPAPANGRRSPALSLLSPSSPSSTAGRIKEHDASLATSVKRLLGTADGLEKLRLSLQDDDMAAGVAATVVAGSAGVGGRGSGDGGGIEVSDRRPSSAPLPTGTMSKKTSVFGGLVQTLVDSNSMSWLGSTTKSRAGSPLEETDPFDSDEGTTKADPKLKVLLVDPQGLVGWVLPRLKEKKARFSVTVAPSAEEATRMMESEVFQVAVVDLHMPRISGVDFCRSVRARDSGTIGIEGSARGGIVLPADHTKLLLHTTAAGMIKSDELEGFLEEGLVNQYVPQPLDITTLFDFLKLFEEEEEEDDDSGARKLSALLNDESKGQPAEIVTDGSSAIGNATSIERGLTYRKKGTGGRGGTASSTDGVAGAAGSGSRGVGGVGAGGGSGGSLLKGWWGSRAPPPPSMDDIASTFFSVKGKQWGADGAANGGVGAGASAKQQQQRNLKHNNSTTNTNSNDDNNNNNGSSPSDQTVGHPPASFSSGGGASPNGKEREAFNRKPGPWKPAPATVFPILDEEGVGGAQGGA